MTYRLDSGWRPRLPSPMRAILTVGLVLIAAGCATVPPESVSLSLQVEKNLETLKRNQLKVLRAWHQLSLDYWSERIGREGPDLIVKKAKAQNITFDPATDYKDLIEQVVSEQRKFQARIEENYLKAYEQIVADFGSTSEAARALTALLDSVVKLDAERRRALQSAGSALAVDDTITKLRDELKTLLGPGAR